ncbi:MAG: hypothetical protein FJW36_19555 [Acidobacteria bacterium]|nr:hypothetical protein [Acidobacteriota bacterium]
MSETKQTQTGVLITSDGRRIDLDEIFEPLVLATIKIIECAGGYNSPFETFIEDLLRDYSWKRLSVSSIETDLQEMKKNFEYMGQDLKLYVERYRPMVDSAIAEADAAETPEAA